MAKKATGRVKPNSYKNKLEERFGAWLTEQQRNGYVLWWEYEGMKFRLGKGAWFTPDFNVLWQDGSFRLYETKGFGREAAIVRIKTAAQHYPFQWYLVRTPRNKKEKAKTEGPFVITEL